MQFTKHKLALMEQLTSELGQYHHGYTPSAVISQLITDAVHYTDDLAMQLKQRQPHESHLKSLTDAQLHTLAQVMTLPDLYQQLQQPKPQWLTDFIANWHSPSK